LKKSDFEHITSPSDLVILDNYLPFDKTPDGKIDTQASAMGTMTCRGMQLINGKEYLLTIYEPNNSETIKSIHKASAIKSDRTGIATLAFVVKELEGVQLIVDSYPSISGDSKDFRGNCIIYFGRPTCPYEAEYLAEYHNTYESARFVLSVPGLGIEKGAQVNKIESITINGSEATISDKNIDIVIPEPDLSLYVEKTKLEDYVTQDIVYTEQTAALVTDRSYPIPGSAGGDFSIYETKIIPGR
jgi:hypothetical protein